MTATIRSVPLNETLAALLRGDAGRWDNLDVSPVTIALDPTTLLLMRE